MSINTHTNTEANDAPVAWTATEDLAPTEGGAASVLHGADHVQPPLVPLWRDVVDAAHSLGVPMLVFGGTFVCLMLVISVLFSPDRFPVRVGVKTVQLSQLLSEKAQLQTVQAALLSHGQDAQSAVPTPILKQVRALAAGKPWVGTAIAASVAAAESFNAGSVPIITVQRVAAEGSAVTLTGEVRDADGRSIQVLASFVDALRKRSAIQSVTEPEYRQTAQSDGSSISPFSLHLTASHAS